MNIVPITLCKNEEVWIARVLAPLVEVFGHAIVADTGSTDGTLDEIAKVPGVHLMRYDNLTMEQVGQVRGWMQAEAKERYGASHVFLIDADELYPRSYLRFIRDNPMPEGSLSGYTYGIECTELPNGECWLMGNAGGLVGVSRQAIFSVESIWRGTYPFESPDTFIAGDPRNFYWSSLDPAHHFYHLHGMTRSKKDGEVYMRAHKKHLFSLAEHPEIQPAQLWLRHESEYKDEDQ